MKIIVPHLEGVSITSKGVSVDISSSHVREWIDLLALYKQKYLVEPYVEPVLPAETPRGMRDIIDGVLRRASGGGR